MGPPFSGSINAAARTPGTGVINFQSLNYNYFLTNFREFDFMSAQTRAVIILTSGPLTLAWIQHLRNKNGLKS